MRVVLAFLRRDLLIWSSYRLAMLWQVASVFFVIGLVYLAGQMLGGSANSTGEQSGGYVAFLLIGIAFTDVFTTSFNSLARSIRESQAMGTFEPLLLTPVTVFVLVIASSLFKTLLSVIRMAIYLVFGIAVLGLWHNANALSIVVVFVPALIAFTALGILSAAFVILVKQGDPVVMAYTGMMALLGGVFFPAEVLPGWVQPLAALVPLTHALVGIRAGLEGAALAELSDRVLVLLAMAMVLLPTSIVTLSWTVRRTKEEGSLGQY